MFNITAVADNIIPLKQRVRKINNETIVQFQLLLKSETWETVYKDNDTTNYKFSSGWHMQCMDDEHMPKRLQYAKTSGRRNVERPRSRWLDEVNTDARRMGIRMWCRKASNREEWRKLLMEAKTLLEL
jgi:hypothetical protein